MKFGYPIIAVFFSLFTISGCATYSQGDMIADRTYEATDSLVRSSGLTNDDKNKPLIVTTISDINLPETSNAFGRLVSEQIAGRLAQRGFHVTELKMRESLNIKRGLLNPSEAGEFLISRDVQALPGEQTAMAAIVGSYALSGSDVIVHLKMLNTVNGQILGSTDYSLPLDRDIKNLLRAYSTVDNDFFGTSMVYN
jgi:TolB-like protein